jgi:hypothetical protein
MFRLQTRTKATTHTDMNADAWAGKQPTLEKPFFLLYHFFKKTCRYPEVAATCLVSIRNLQKL